MELRMRRDGKTYKCFTDRTSDFKFYSKPEVLRHLKNVNKKSSKSKKTKRKSTNKRTDKPATINYVVKKSVAEGLPPGWIEEMRVRKKGGRDHKADKYYIDPESGRVFRSMKEVSRYLETGALGRSTLKSKEKGHVNDGPSNHTSSTRAEDETKGVPKSKTNKVILKDQALKSVAEGERVEITESKANKEVNKDHDTKSSAEGEGDRVPDGKGAGGERDKVPESRKNKEVVKDQELKSSTEGEGDRVPKSKTNDEAVKDQHLKSGPKGKRERDKTLPADKKLKKRKKESDFSESLTILTTLKTDDITEKLSPVNSAERHGNITVHHKKNKLNDETETALPRRISKRLAGVKVHQLQELETNSRAHQVASEQLSETIDIKKSIKNLTSSDKQIRKVLKGSGSHQLVETVDTRKNIKDLNSSVTHIRGALKGSGSYGKRQGPVLLPAGYLPLSQGYAKTLGTGCERDKDVAVSLDSSGKDFLNDPCIEFAIKTLTCGISIEDDKAHHNQGSSASNADPASSLSIPCRDLWTDPCFEFAVKTLTGEIPVENNLLPHSSSEAQRHNGLSSATVKSDSFSPVNHLFNHFVTAEKPFYRQQNLLAPATSCIPNGSS